MGARSNQHHQERTNNTKKKKKKKKKTTTKKASKQKVGELQLGRLQSVQKAPWDEDAIRSAHENNRPDCVQYLLDNNCPLPEGWSYEDGELHIVAESESESE